MFKRIKSLIDHYWLLILIFWVALAIFLKIVSPTWEEVALDGDLDYLPRNSTSMKGLELLQKAFPDERAKSEIVLVFSRQDGPLTSQDDRQFALATAEKLESSLKGMKDPVFVDMWTETTEVIGDMLKSKDGHATMVVARTTRDMMAIDNISLLNQVKALTEEARRNAPAGLAIGITGSAMIGGDIQDSVVESVKNTETTTVVLVLLALILIYRAPLLVLVPLATIAVSQSVAMDLTALAARYFGPEYIPWSTFKIFTTSKIFVVVILYGAATDYCLFLISRYKEELADGSPVREAPGKALYNVGNALAGSAFTTIFGLSTMIFAEYGKFVYSGPVVGGCLFVAALACVTFSPALLRAIGPAVFWPFGIKRVTEQIEANAAALDYGVKHSEDVARGRADWSAGLTLRLWNGIAQFILKRPATILFMSVWLALPFVLAGVHVEVTHDFVAELAHDRETIRGTAKIREHFGPGSVAPITVIARLPNGDLNSKDGKYTIAYLHHELYKLKEEGFVEDVRSLYQPVGGVPGSTKITRKVASGSPIAQEKFVSHTKPYAGEVTQLAVVITEEPFSKKARDISGHIKEKLDEFSKQKTLEDGEPNQWYGASFDLVGTTPGLRDLELTTKADQTRIQVCTMIAVFLVLLVIIRKPLACVYLMVTVLVSYWVTIGMTELFFRWYYDFVGVTYHGIDWKVPVFLFVILIAVGQDYNIYLTTRVVEEQEKLGQRKGLWRAIVQTGGIITSCGVIMAGTFVSMMTGTLWGMIELGFALSLGVLLDTFFVRTVVVPCYFALMARWFPDKEVPADASAILSATEKAPHRMSGRHSSQLAEPAR